MRGQGCFRTTIDGTPRGPGSGPTVVSPSLDRVVIANGNARSDTGAVLIENPSANHGAWNTYTPIHVYTSKKEVPVPYSPVLVVHILAATVGLFSGTAALCFRKGSPRHVMAGRVFVASMLTMAVGAVYLAIVKQQTGNIGGGFITFYLIGSGWLTVRRKPGETSRMDWLTLLIPVTLGIFTWANGIGVIRSGATAKDGVPVYMSFFMGSICLLAAAGDFRMLTRGGVVGKTRITRHLWRMCFGLFIASGSFFMGPSNRPLRLLSGVGLGRHLPAALFSVDLYLVLTLLPLALLIFWLARVRFTNAFQSKSIPLAGDAYKRVPA